VPLEAISTHLVHSFSKGRSPQIECVTTRTRGEGQPTALAAMTQYGEGFVGIVKDEGKKVGIIWEFPDSNKWNMEPGWGGVDLHPTDQEQFLTARYYQKSVVLHQNGQQVRTISASQRPCQAKFVPGEVSALWCLTLFRG